MLKTDLAVHNSIPDADDFEPKVDVLSKPKPTDKWEGEDEDDDIKVGGGKNRKAET